MTEKAFTNYELRITDYEHPVRILIAAGGSGGHIFPAIALGRALKRSGARVDIRYVGSDKDLDRRLFEKEGSAYSLLFANKLPYRPSIAHAGVACMLLLDIIRSFSLLLRYRPDVVAGFGGYVSFPVLFASRVLRIPTIVHEQNVVPGRANRSLFRMSDRIAISFDETRAALGDRREKAVFTGNPIRSEIFTDDKLMGRRRFGLDPEKFTVLLIGGSQGAHALNKVFIEALGLMDHGSKSAMQVIHITGVKDYEWALEKYAEARVDHRVHSFMDRIEEAYAACDLAVTRSGASALFELALLGRPMVLVPYPFAMSHQAENAAAFSRNGAAVVLEEKNLSADIFKDTLAELMVDRDRLKRIGEAAKQLSVPDASAMLAKEVLALAGK